MGRQPATSAGRRRWIPDHSPATNRDVDVEHWELRAAPEGGEAEAPGAPGALPDEDRFVILCVARGKSTLIMHRGHEWKAGDVAAVALHRPDRESVHGALRALGFEPRAQPQESEPAPNAA